jgi:hypothetical protein
MNQIKLEPEGSTFDENFNKCEYNFFPKFQTPECHIDCKVHVSVGRFSNDSPKS